MTSGSLVAHSTSSSDDDADTMLQTPTDAQLAAARDLTFDDGGGFRDCDSTNPQRNAWRTFNDHTLPECLDAMTGAVRTADRKSALYALYECLRLHMSIVAHADAFDAPPSKNDPHAHAMYTTAMKKLHDVPARLIHHLQHLLFHQTAAFMQPALTLAVLTSIQAFVGDHARGANANSLEMALVLLTGKTARRSNFIDDIVAYFAQPGALDHLDEGWVSPGEHLHVDFPFSRFAARGNRSSRDVTGSEVMEACINCFCTCLCDGLVADAVGWVFVIVREAYAKDEQADKKNNRKRYKHRLEGVEGFAGATWDYVAWAALVMRAEQLDGARPTPARQVPRSSRPSAKREQEDLDAAAAAANAAPPSPAQEHGLPCVDFVRALLAAYPKHPKHREVILIHATLYCIHRDAVYALDTTWNTLRAYDGVYRGKRMIPMRDTLTRYHSHPTAHKRELPPADVEMVDPVDAASLAPFVVPEWTVDDDDDDDAQAKKKKKKTKEKPSRKRKADDNDSDGKSKAAPAAAAAASAVASTAAVERPTAKRQRVLAYASPPRELAGRRIVSATLMPGMPPVPVRADQTPYYRVVLERTRADGTRVHFDMFTRPYAPDVDFRDPDVHALKARLVPTASSPATLRRGAPRLVGGQAVADGRVWVVGATAGEVGWARMSIGFLLPTMPALINETRRQGGHPVIALDMWALIMWRWVVGCARTDLDSARDISYDAADPTQLAFSLGVSACEEREPGVQIVDYAHKLWTCRCEETAIRARDFFRQTFSADHTRALLLQWGHVLEHETPNPTRIDKFTLGRINFLVRMLSRDGTLEALIPKD